MSGALPRLCLVVFPGNRSLTFLIRGFNFDLLPNARFGLHPTCCVSLFDFSGRSFACYRASRVAG